MKEELRSEAGSVWSEAPFSRLSHFTRQQPIHGTPHSMTASPQPPVHLVLVGFELLGGCHLKA